MLDTAKIFHDKGFAIHWLMSRSKRPIEKKWTTGPRKSMKELTLLYRKGMNIGVRLGEVSEIEGRFLAVIDCDVKSDQPKHLREMQAKINELFPGIEKAAIVASGRANGSRHYYVVTKVPTTTRRLAQSNEKVELRMPSADPSKWERENMHEAKLARGFRMRPAWEISIMGTGSQVVLPPSIHPDTGKPYTWLREWQRPFLLKGVQNPTSTDSKPLESDIGPVDTTKEIDLAARRVPAKIIAAIEDGEGVEDRSAALFKVAMAMLRAGLTDAEVVSVLTDRRTYLGKAAFDHAKTTSRERAAKWIVKYTLPRAKRETDPTKDFMEEPPEKLSKKAAKAQAEEFEEEFASSWETKIERGPVNLGAKVKPTLKNLILILENAVGKEIFRYNAFSSADLYGMKAPWGGKRGDEIRDADTINMKVWFAEAWRVEPNQNLINEAICFVAKKNTFHPVKNYLDKLEWDGVKRIDTWLKTYLEADAPEPYLSAVSRKMLVAMVARAYEPGRKYDQVVILQGNQGEGKSTALLRLASDEWFSDATLNLQDKDSILSMRSIWLRELGELSGMRKGDVDQLKEFISRRTDRIRVPYGKRTENFPRQCIFVGTTNKEEFLRDDTGNRRYWPVTVGKCHFDSIERDRDQLFAEARIAWELGEPLYMEEAEAEKIAVQEQSKRMESDMLSEHLQKFIRLEKKKPEKERFNLEKFQLSELFEVLTHVSLKDDRMGQLRLGSALRSLGFMKRMSRKKNGHWGKYWGMCPS